MLSLTHVFQFSIQLSTNIGFVSFLENETTIQLPLRLWIESAIHFFWNVKSQIKLSSLNRSKNRLAKLLQAVKSVSVWKIAEYTTMSWVSIAVVISK